VGDLIVGMQAPELHILTMLTVGDIAEVAGVSKATIDSYRYRGVLPEPQATSGRTPLWARPIIRHWLATRSGPGWRSDLYGERDAANGGGPETSPAASADGTPDAVERDRPRPYGCSGRVPGFEVAHRTQPEGRLHRGRNGWRRSVPVDGRRGRRVRYRPRILTDEPGRAVVQDRHPGRTFVPTTVGELVHLIGRLCAEPACQRQLVGTEEMHRERVRP
jgi:predicted DNA-binding transcriptional regulator AlpA